MAEDLFESAEALLRWAYEDATRLKRSVRRFFDKHPCTHGDEFNPETGNYAHKVKVVGTPPETWRRLTFRVICDIRHCVDQAMFAATHRVLGAPPAGDIYFPWARCPDDLEYRMRKIPEQLHPTVRRLEPYRRGNDYPGGDNTVYAIRTVAGPNKHRVAVSPAIRNTAFDFKGVVNSGEWFIPYDGWDPAKNEFTIIDNIPPGTERDYTFKLAFDVAFGEVEGLTGKPVLPVLGHFGSYAAFVIEELSEDSARLASL